MHNPDTDIRPRQAHVEVVVGAEESEGDCYGVELRRLCTSVSGSDAYNVAEQTSGEHGEDWEMYLLEEVVVVVGLPLRARVVDAADHLGIAHFGRELDLGFAEGVDARRVHPGLHCEGPVRRQLWCIGARLSNSAPKSWRTEALPYIQCNDWPQESCTWDEGAECAA